jgi:hypothetical protein
MIIPGDEIIYKNRIGLCGNKVLWAIGTIGGLNLIEARSPDGKREVIGAGSHKAVAKHIAKKSHPDIEWTVLEKSNEPQLQDFADTLPFWEAIVQRVNSKI